MKVRNEAGKYFQVRPKIGTQKPRGKPCVDSPNSIVFRMTSSGRIYVTILLREFFPGMTADLGGMLYGLLREDALGFLFL